MTIRDNRKLFDALIALIAIGSIQACECDNSSLSEDAGSASNAGSQSDRIDARSLLNSEYDSETDAMTDDAMNPIEGPSRRHDGDVNNAVNEIPSSRIVTVNDLSVEMIDKFIGESTNWSDRPALESGPCGYSMTIASSNPATTQNETRLFDEEGKLLVQQSDTVLTEIFYDKEDRPVSIWRKERSLLFSQWSQAVITAVEYNIDGSAISKTVFQLSGGDGGCVYLVLNQNHDIETYIRDQACDDSAEIEVDMHYSQDGKPLRYWRQEPGFSESEIVWSYQEDGRQVQASWNDSIDGESVLDFDFDTSDKLVSIRVDYKNDGEIDESTEYNYDDQGNMVRTATDLDQDGIIDLLRINNYDQNGLLATRELRNLLSPEFVVHVWDSEFEYVAPATAKKTVYTYDNELKLVETVTESHPDKGEFRSERETFRYDDLDRLIEQRVETNFYHDNSIGTRELDHLNVTTCTFDYPCDNHFDESSEQRRCSFEIPAHDLLFPFSSLREIPFHSNRTHEYDLEISFDPEDVLGIPWY